MENRKIVEAEVDCDTNRLYGTIDEAIAYLIEVRDKHCGTDIGLDEHWTGYEDMQMRFVYSREENDQEYASRMQSEAWRTVRSKLTVKPKRRLVSNMRKNIGF